MLSFFLRYWRRLCLWMSANDSPRQVAGGFVLGMLLGMLPIGNLIAALLVILLVCLRVNKPAGLAAAIVFSLMGFALEPIAQQVGALVLTWEPMRPMLAWLHRLPCGSWLGLGKTMVVGKLMLGLYLAYPVYWVVWQFGERVQPRLYAWLDRSKLARWVRRADFKDHWGYNI